MISDCGSHGTVLLLIAGPRRVPFGVGRQRPLQRFEFAAPGSFRFASYSAHGRRVRHHHADHSLVAGSRAQRRDDGAVVSAPGRARLQMCQGISFALDREPSICRLVSRRSTTG